MSTAIQIQQPYPMPGRSLQKIRPRSVQGENSFLAELIARAEEHDSAPPIVQTAALSEPKKAPLPAGAALLMRLWQWFRRNQSFSAAKQLRVSDTVSLGEKRFVAVVHIEGRKFLIGGGASGVSLLTQLSEDSAQNGNRAASPTHAE